jgi:hypothetical protein
MYLVKGEVRIELESIGEGYNGDYNPDDIEDEELLRFYVQKKENGEWVDVADASYCTLFPASATEDEKRRGLEFLMDNFYDAVMSGKSVKKIGERMSWISLIPLGGVNVVKAL